MFSIETMRAYRCDTSNMSPIDLAAANYILQPVVPRSALQAVKPNQNETGDLCTHETGLFSILSLCLPFLSQRSFVLALLSMYDLPLSSPSGHQSGEAT